MITDQPEESLAYETSFNIIDTISRGRWLNQTDQTILKSY